MALNLWTFGSGQFDLTSLTRHNESKLSFNLLISTNSKLYDFPVNVNFTYGDESQVHNETNGMIAQLPTLSFSPSDNQSQSIKIEALKVGHLVVGAISNEIKM